MVDTVAARGYRNARVDEVLERAHVSRASFSAMFTGKEDCFIAAIRDAVWSLERAVQAAWPQEASWPERVRAGLQAFVQGLVSDPARTRGIMVESGLAGPAAAQEMRSAYQRFVPFFDEGYEQVTHDLPGQTSDAVVGGIALTIQRYVAGGDIQGLWNVLPDLVYFALVPYLGHRRACALALA